MVALTWVGCILFEAPVDPPPPPAETEATPQAMPVPRDTGSPGDVDRNTLTGTWEGTCAVDEAVAVPFGGTGDSGIPMGDSGVPEQAARVTMDIVEVPGGQIFGGATLALLIGGEPQSTLGAGVTGTREESVVQLLFVVGLFPLGSVEGTWNQQSDELLGTFTFDGDEQSATCLFTR